MTDAAFAALVERVERLSHEQPARHRLGMRAWIALGYLAFGAVLLLGLGLAAVAVGALISGKWLFLLGGGIKLALPLLVVVVALLRGLTARVPPPEGRPLDRDEAPALFEMIDALRRDLDAPPVDTVLLTADLNAGVIELPRFGTLPFYRRVLLVGLPMLRALPVGELRAVLAHEFGHLSRAHSASAGRVYQLRRSWLQVAAGLERTGSGGLVAGFLRWYLPRFSAWTFVVSRRNEDEADDCAARIAGREASRDALVRTALAGRAEPRFWEQRARADLDENDLPSTILRDLSAALAAAPAAASAPSDLVALMLETPDLTDTHPALSQRLDRLELGPRLPPPVETDAATALLADADALEAELGAALARGMGPAWRAMKRELRMLRARLDALDAEIARGQLAPAALAERADLTERLRGPAAALDAWRVAHSVDPTARGARFHLGRLLVSVADDPAGAELLGALADEDPRAVPIIAEVLVPWLRRRERPEAAQDWIARARAAVDESAADEAARVALGRGDTLVPTTLSPARLAALVATLRNTVGIQQAILAEKAGSEDEEGEPLRVLLVRMSAADRDDRDEAFSALVGWFEEPGHWHIADESAPGWLWRKARKLGEDAVLPV